jgi:ABC-type nickel/cobalt efflux system permease component RcnA
MSNSARGLRDRLRAAHPIARAAAAAAGGVAAFYGWMIVGFVTGVVRMCATASEAWIDAWFVLLAAVPIWATWKTWRLLRPDEQAPAPGKPAEAPEPI